MSGRLVGSGEHDITRPVVSSVIDLSYLAGWQY
jgi:hypothetical protein